MEVKREKQISGYWKILTERREKRGERREGREGREASGKELR